MGARAAASRTSPSSTRAAAPAAADRAGRSTRARDANLAWNHLTFGVRPASEAPTLSPGDPLPSGARRFLEPRLGADVGAVRIHTDAKAADGADALSARAYAYGRDIFFGRDQFSPNTLGGLALIAHELTHVVQARHGLDRIARSPQKIGNADVDVDYAKVIPHDKAAEYQKQIATRFAAYTSKPAASIKAAVAALTDPQRRWVLFGIELLSKNPVPGLDTLLAANRLIAFAPAAVQTPTAGNKPPFDFENEVLRASGWFEFKLTDKLTDPDAKTQAALDPEYNPGGVAAGNAGSTSCPATRAVADQLDEPLLIKDVTARTTDFFTSQMSILSSLKPTSDSFANVSPLADVVQAEALTFFSPYIGASHTRAFQTTWKYSAHLKSTTTPGAIPKPVRKAFIANRAQRAAADAKVLDKAHFDARCTADRAAFDKIVDTLDADAKVQSSADALLSWQSFTGHNDTSAEVTANIQHRAGDDECEARWKVVETLCHELMHVYGSQDFYDASQDRELIEEGFPEILGDQLYEQIRTKAADAKYRAGFEGGLSAGACTGVAVPASHRGYKTAANAAERIRSTVGDDSFRAAYFLGRKTLAGLKT
jgi:hypothetical protein